MFCYPFHTMLFATRDVPNHECILDTTNSYPYMNAVNLSFKLPCYGTFSAGTGKCSSGEPYWVADNSGGGQVISYDTTVDAYGEVGLKCWVGQTAAIELSTTIVISTTGCACSPLYRSGHG